MHKNLRQKRSTSLCLNPDIPLGFVMMDAFSRQFCCE
jgi:hypothetical protein